MGLQPTEVLKPSQNTFWLHSKTLKRPQTVPMGSGSVFGGNVLAKYELIDHCMGYAVLCWESWWSGPSSGSRTPCSFIPWAVAGISCSMQIHWNLWGSGHCYFSELWYEDGLRKCTSKTNFRLTVLPQTMVQHISKGHFQNLFRKLGK